MAAERSVTRENLGAWVLKGSPKIFNVNAVLKDPNDLIEDWSVVLNYRSEMMEPGDRVMLWVSGSDRDLPRGIWAIGEVTGPVRPATIAERGDWIDDEARKAVRYMVDVSMGVLSRPILDVDLRGVGIADLEVQVAAQGSNPSWVTKDQMRRIVEAFPRATARRSGKARDEDEEQIVLSPRGASFGTPEQNKVVELAAMRAVTTFYRNGGWEVDDVSSDKVGWDLTCTNRDQIAHVEVKGVSGSLPVVLLTANEVEKARTQENWWLAVVTEALTDDPAITEYAADEVQMTVRPLVYRADLRPPG